MLALYSAAVKRFVLLMLLAVLPIQTAWAAGVGHCPQGDGQRDRAPAPHERPHAADVHDHGIGHDHGVPGHTAGAGLDCSAFHFVALEPILALAQALPPVGVTAGDSENSGYKSHIPDGPERPCWRAAV